MNFEKLKPVLNDWYARANERTNGRAENFKFMFEIPTGDKDIIIDLHNHSLLSDGSLSPEYTAELAKRNGVKHYATTDHDNIGIDEKLNGVEVTCKLGGNEIEINVYGFDYEKAKELIYGGEFPYLDRKFKINRNFILANKRIELVNKLKLTDSPLSINDLLQIHPLNENGEKQTLTFTEAGLDINTLKEAYGELPKTATYQGKLFDIDYNNFIRKTYLQIINSKNGIRFLNSKAEIDKTFSAKSYDDFYKMVVTHKYGELHVDNDEYFPTVEQVIDFAHKAGAIAVLNHPFAYGKKIQLTSFELLMEAYKRGIDGVEVMHGFSQSDEVEALAKEAYRLGLIPTMGSDKHGEYSYQGDKMSPGLFPGVGYQARFTEGNIFGEIGSLYNFMFYFSGAWRGEKEFDPDSVPPTIKNVIDVQRKRIAEQIEQSKKVRENAELLAHETAPSSSILEPEQ